MRQRQPRQTHQQHLESPSPPPKRTKNKSKGKPKNVRSKGKQGKHWEDIQKAAAEASGQRSAIDNDFDDGQIDETKKKKKTKESDLLQKPSEFNVHEKKLSHE